MRPQLRSDQIAEVLRRCQFPPDTEILGILYEDAGVRMSVGWGGDHLAVLSVPEDILQMPAPVNPEPHRVRLFD